MRYKMLSALSLTLIASACATNSTETARTVHSYCLLAKGISYSGIQPTQTETAANSYDTPATVDQVVVHNVTYLRTCPQPAAPAP